jgi:hypothetical protein
MSQALRIEVRTPDDARGIASAVSPLVWGDAPATDAVDIVLPGGEIEGLQLQLGSPMDPRLLRVTVRGGGTTLHSAKIALAGAEIVLEDLVLDGPPTAGETLRLQARTSVELTRVTVRGQRPAEPHPGARQATGLRIEAVAAGVVAALTDLTASGNTASPLFTFTGQGGGSFREVRIVRGRFDENAGPELQLGPVDTVRVEESVRTGGKGPFAASASPRTVILSEPVER